MNPPIPTLEPLTDTHATVHRPHVSEKVLYGGFSLLIAYAIYVPFQLKIDARLGLSHIPIPGLAVVNVLFLLSLGKMLRSTKPKAKPDGPTTHISRAILGFGVFSILALLYGTIRTAGSTFAEDFTIWKRWFSMLFLFWFTRKFLHSAKQLRWLMFVMSFVLLFASVNLLRENLSTGMSSSSYREGLRFGGVFDWGGENDLGAFFAELIFIPFALFFIEKNFIKKTMLLGTVAIVGMGCIFTYSRAAWIGLSVGLTAYLCRRTKTGLIWVAALMFVVIPLLPASVVSRWDMTRDSETGKVEASGQMRLDVWNEGLRLISENPLTGVGYNRFRYEVRLKNFDNMHLEPHNAYMKIAAEMGIPALLWFIYLLISAFRLTGRAQPGLHRELACAFTGFLFAFLAVNFFGNRIQREALIGYFMMFCGIMVWLRTEHDQSDLLSEPAS